MHPSCLFILIYRHSVLAFSTCLNRELLQLAQMLCMLCCFIVSADIYLIFQIRTRANVKCLISKKINPISGYANLPRCSWEYWRQLIAAKITFLFLKVQWLHFIAEIDESKIADGKLIPDFVYQKLFKLVHFWLSYSRNNKVAFFSVVAAVKQSTVHTPYLSTLQRYSPW